MGRGRAACFPAGWSEHPWSGRDQGWVGRSFFQPGGAKVKIRGARRGWAKKPVNQLIQKYDKCALIEVLIKEDIISFHFKRVFL